MKLKIHPLFIIASLFVIIQGDALLLCSYIAAILMHEVAHARMAALRGYTLGTVTIMPYGGVINGGERYGRSDNILIALAGPAVNIIIGLLTVALWWLAPVTYVYTKSLCIANLSLAIINLLPLYPLDGSRIVLSLAKNKLRALCGLKIAGIIISVILVVLSIISVLFTFNLSIGIMGVFLFYCALWGTDDEAYIHIASMSPLAKDYNSGVEKRSVYISHDTPLFRVLPLIKRDCITTFIIVSGDNLDGEGFDEKQLEDMCVLCDLSEHVGKAYRAINKKI